MVAFAQSVYLIFASVYVCKETVEHLLLSSGEGHHHHNGDEVQEFFGSVARVDTLVQVLMAFQGGLPLPFVTHHPRLAVDHHIRFQQPLKAR